MDAKGYMCFQDVEVWEEVDDIKSAKRSAPIKANLSQQSTGQKQAPPKTMPAKQAAGKKA